MESTVDDEASDTESLYEFIDCVDGDITEEDTDIEEENGSDLEDEPGEISDIKLNTVVIDDSLEGVANLFEEKRKQMQTATKTVCLTTENLSQNTCFIVVKIING